MRMSLLGGSGPPRRASTLGISGYENEEEVEPKPSLVRANSERGTPALGAESILNNKRERSLSYVSHMVAPNTSRRESYLELARSNVGEKIRRSVRSLNESFHDCSSRTSSMTDRDDDTEYSEDCNLVNSFRKSDDFWNDRSDNNKLLDDESSFSLVFEKETRNIEEDLAAKKIQRFFRYSLLVLEWHKEEFEYWEHERLDVQRRLEEELSDVAKFVEAETQRVALELRLQYSKGQDENGFDEESYLKWSREQEELLQLVQKEREEGEELKDSIRQLTSDNLRLGRGGNLRVYKMQCLKEEVGLLEHDRSKWKEIRRNVQSAIAKLKRKIDKEQGKINEAQKENLALKHRIAVLTDTAEVQDNQTVGIKEVNQLSYTSASVNGIFIFKSCPRDEAARRIQRFFREAMVEIAYYKDELRYWEIEKADVERRRQEELQDRQSFLEMEKRKLLLEFQQEKEEETPVDDKSQVAAESEIQEYKKHLQKEKEEGERLRGEIHLLVQKNKWIDHMNTQNRNQARTTNDTVEALEKVRVQLLDIPLGFGLAIKKVKREIALLDTRMNQEQFLGSMAMYSDRIMQNKAARCIQKFFRGARANLERHREEVRYWEEEKKDVERRRVEELEDVRRAIELEKRQVQLSMMGDDALVHAGANSPCGWNKLSNDMNQLKSQLEKEKRERRKLIGDTRLLVHKSKQLRQTNPTQIAAVQNISSCVIELEKENMALKNWLEMRQKEEATLQQKLDKIQQRYERELERKSIGERCTMEMLDRIESRIDGTKAKPSEHEDDLWRTIRQIPGDIMGSLQAEKDSRSCSSSKALRTSHKRPALENETISSGYWREIARKRERAIEVFRTALAISKGEGNGALSTNADGESKNGSSLWRENCGGGELNSIVKKVGGSKKSAAKQSKTLSRRNGGIGRRNSDPHIFGRKSQLPLTSALVEVVETGLEDTKGTDQRVKARKLSGMGITRQSSTPSLVYRIGDVEEGGDEQRSERKKDNGKAQRVKSSKRKAMASNRRNSAPLLTLKKSGALLGEKKKQDIGDKKDPNLFYCWNDHTEQMGSLAVADSREKGRRMDVTRQNSVPLLVRMNSRMEVTRQNSVPHLVRMNSESLVTSVAGKGNEDAEGWASASKEQRVRSLKMRKMLVTKQKSVPLLRSSKASEALLASGKEEKDVEDTVEVDAKTKSLQNRNMVIGRQKSTPELGCRKRGTLLACATEEEKEAYSGDRKDPELFYSWRDHLKRMNSCPSLTTVRDGKKKTKRRGSGKLTKDSTKGVSLHNSEPRLSWFGI